MDPVFTLQWTEYVVAEKLGTLFPKKDDFSVLIPTSRQEKGIDLGLVKKCDHGKSSVALIQVKASRSYIEEPPKRASTVRFKHNTWFNRFDPSPQADFFVLVGLYPPDTGRTKPVDRSWYRACMLLFTYQELITFLDGCKTKEGKPDGKFGFGFNDESKIVWTRGDANHTYSDYSSFLISNRRDLLAGHF